MAGRLELIASTALALAAACLAGAPQAARAGNAVLPAYFNPGDARAFAPLVFMRQAPPPANNAQNRTSYAYGPITDSAALNVGGQNASTWSGGHNWPFVWANRARVPPGQVLIEANPIYPAILDPRGNQYRVEYTTVARANAATKAEILYIMGAAPSVWQAPLTAAGISAVPWVLLSAKPTLYFKLKSQDGKSTVMVDKMAIPATVSRSAHGIAVDYEVQDHRRAVDTHPFLDDLGATIRGFGLKAYLYTNPWNSASVQYSGFDFARMDDIKANFDYVSLLVWDPQNHCNAAVSYPASVKFLKGVSGKLNFSQILLTVDLANCNVLDAALIAAQHAIDHFAGYNIWDDGAVDGGSALTGSNLVIWTLLHGG